MRFTWFSKTAPGTSRQTFLGATWSILVHILTAFWRVPKSNHFLMINIINCFVQDGVSKSHNSWTDFWCQMESLYNKKLTFHIIRVAIWKVSLDHDIWWKIPPRSHRKSCKIKAAGAQEIILLWFMDVSRGAHLFVFLGSPKRRRQIQKKTCSFTKCGHMP